MDKSFLFLVGLLAFFGCNDKSDDINGQRSTEREDASTKSKQVFFAPPQQIDSSGIIMYPLILEKKSNSGVSVSSSYGERISYWNVIFYNTGTNTRQLLVTNKKMVIHSVDTESGSSYSSYSSFVNDGVQKAGNSIFYTVISKDFNDNALLDDEDPSYLFVSDKEGNNFRQLSPDDYHVFSWNVVRGTNKVILQATRDVNGDKKFTHNDGEELLIADLSSGTQAVPTFGSSYIDSVKSVYSATWQAKRP